MTVTGRTKKAPMEEEEEERPHLRAELELYK